MIITNWNIESVFSTSLFNELRAFFDISRIYIVVAIFTCDCTCSGHDIEIDGTFLEMASVEAVFKQFLKKVDGLQQEDGAGQSGFAREFQVR